MSFDATNIGKVIYAVCNSTIPCYPILARQQTQAPYLVYHILSNDPDNIKGAIPPVDHVTVLLNIYESTAALCASKAITIRGLLDDKAGTYGGVVVDKIRFITESDDYDDDLKLYIKTIEYLFRIKN